MTDVAATRQCLPRLITLSGTASVPPTQHREPAGTTPQPEQRHRWHQSHPQYLNIGAVIAHSDVNAVRLSGLPSPRR
jgi:hypothetical protein